MYVSCKSVAYDVRVMATMPNIFATLTCRRSSSLLWQQANLARNYVTAI